MSKRDRVTTPNESSKLVLLFQSHTGKKRMRFVIRLSSTSMTSSEKQIWSVVLTVFAAGAPFWQSRNSRGYYCELQKDILLLHVIKREGSSFSLDVI